LKTASIPVDAAGTHGTLCRWNIGETSFMTLICEHNASNALWVTEQLVYLMAPGDAIMAAFFIAQNYYQQL
jgi:hypothetical protein